MSAEITHNSPPSADGGPGLRVWSLVLPQADRLVCYARTPPQFALELARRGVRVDVVSRCDFELWTDTLQGAPPELRCLWEPDPDANYDAAVLWDPETGADVRDWLARVRALPVAPRELAAWSRNPLTHSGAPYWWRMDAWMEHAGWRLGTAQLGLPHVDRVRQIVDWDAYAHTPLIRHRRTHRAWRAWLARQPASRWTVPARLRRASRGSVNPSASILEAILADLAQTCNASPHVDQFLVSPNGTAIVLVQLLGAPGAERVVLKVPFTAAAEPRVIANAAALDWLALQAPRLGSWSAAFPRLRARGCTGGWSWTAEEFAAGSDAQSWTAAEKDRALEVLGGCLETFAALGTPARSLDAAALDAHIGASFRDATRLLPAPLAERLNAVRTRLLDALRDVPVPLVPRHGDFKLENVLGRADAPESWRVLDWELWMPRGLPLLDAWHLIASRRSRDAGCAMGSAVRRWVLAGDLSAPERALLGRLSRGLDPRYVAVAPLLYWLDRVGPVAARGAWPAPGWVAANVTPVLEALPASGALEVGT